ncbi:CDP-glycerol glycerophosphotransferase family protein [Candidatus Neptunichlamydia sp. REUL1]|uniref:CDP-glycerol glycerophosphotransferase family protein n=1 Tax=Candidatus Neptunichlamydia sp. REUL1 TaxID=3064277 RepID=UPI00292D0A9A|nr:CDP-glycerol glycerophosphotransferase family protein [Candidatus Neptunochlamydia sp. REUL1]
MIIESFPKIATLIYGNQKHYLDHLAPLASLLGVPLVVTDFEIERLAKSYYPDLNLLYFDPVEMAEQMVSQFEVVISCLPKDLFDSLFFITTTLHQKCLMNVWCPHGNSDKGHSSYFMEGLSKEKRAFVYGQKMIDFLKEKGAFEQLEDLFILGNYRYEYYLQHIDFYQKILEEKLPINRKRRTLLYAPTWNDSERSSSFEIAHSFLINSVPKDWNLIIKPHPHLKCPLESPKENVIILKDLPPIYPLLQSVDVYLGDMSSIGYDFLTFRRPLFFYNPQNRNPNEDQGLYLTRCGTIIDANENPFEKIDEIDPVSFLKIQDHVYNEVFDKDQTRAKIYDILSETV